MLALCAWLGWVFGLYDTPRHGVAALEPGLKTVSGGVALPSRPRFLLLFEERTSRLTSMDELNMVADLLGHYPVNVTVQGVAAYRPGELGSFDAFVYLGNRRRALPRDLALDVERFPGPVVWLGRNLLERVAGRPVGFRTAATYRLADTVGYRGRFGYPRLPFSVLPVRLLPGAEAAVLAEARGPLLNTPLVVREGKLTYVSTTDFREMTGWVLADLLAEIAQQACPSCAPSSAEAPAKRVMVRLEDVHPLGEPTRVRAAVAYLHREGIPFQVALIPVYSNPRQGVTVRLRDRPEMVAALQEAERLGGVIVQHGDTHQIGRAETAVGWEFWNPYVERPTMTAREAEERIRAGRDELLAAGLHPVAFEAPHYGIHPANYRAVARYYNAYSGRLQVSGVTHFALLEAPFAFTDRASGLWVTPENLGFVNPRLPDPVRAVLDRAELLAAWVRDPVAGVAFHPYLDDRYLREMVQGLKRQGYRFTSAIPPAANERPG